MAKKPALASGIKLAEASIFGNFRSAHTLVINFNYLKQTIDLVGGIDLNISLVSKTKNTPS